jgi:hypothetical protein
VARRTLGVAHARAAEAGRLCLRRVGYRVVWDAVLRAFPAVATGRVASVVPSALPGGAADAAVLCGARQRRRAVVARAAAACCSRCTLQGSSAPARERDRRGGGGGVRAMVSKGTRVIK